jgi:hypothetical protein
MDYSSLDLSDPFIRQAVIEDYAAENGLDLSDPYIKASVEEEFTPAEGGFLASAANVYGQTIKGVGRIASDYFGADENNAVTQYGQEVIDENPLAVKGFSDIAKNPMTTALEAVGNAAPSIASGVGLRAVGHGVTALAPFTGPAAPVVALTGQAISWLGPMAIAALPSYSGIRDKQIFNDPENQDSAKAKAVAVFGAGAVGAIEQSFGPQNWAMALVTKEGREALAKKFASDSIAGAIGKGAAKGAVVEGAEELVQSPIEQVSSFEDPTTKESLTDTALSGTMGAIGGGLLGGGFGAYEQLQQKKVEVTPPETVIAAESVEDAIAAAEQEVESVTPPPQEVAPPGIGDVGLQDYGLEDAPQAPQGILANPVAPAPSMDRVSQLLQQIRTTDKAGMPELGNIVPQFLKDNPEYQPYLQTFRQEYQNRMKQLYPDIPEVPSGSVQDTPPTVQEPVSGGEQGVSLPPAGPVAGIAQGEGAPDAASGLNRGDVGTATTQAVGKTETEKSIDEDVDAFFGKRQPGRTKEEKEAIAAEKAKYREQIIGEREYTNDPFTKDWHELARNEQSFAKELDRLPDLAEAVKSKYYSSFSTTMGALFEGNANIDKLPVSGGKYSLRAYKDAVETMGSKLSASGILRRINSLNKAYGFKEITAAEASGIYDAVIAKKQQPAPQALQQPANPAGGAVDTGSVSPVQPVGTDATVAPKLTNREKLEAKRATARGVDQPVEENGPAQFYPLRLITDEKYAAEQASKQPEEQQSMAEKAIGGLQELIATEKAKLEELRTKKYKPNAKKVSVGGDRDSLNSTEMTIGAINSVKRKRAIAGAEKTVSKLMTALESIQSGKFDDDHAMTVLNGLSDDGIFISAPQQPMRQTVSQDATKPVAPEKKQAAQPAKTNSKTDLPGAETVAAPAGSRQAFLDYAKRVSEASNGKWAADIFSLDGNTEYYMPDAQGTNNTFTLDGIKFTWSYVTATKKKGSSMAFTNPGVSVSADGKHIGTFKFGSALGGETQAVRAALRAMQKYTAENGSVREEDAKQTNTPQAETPRVEAAEPAGREQQQPIRRGDIGGMIASGEVVLTSSGRKTTPFPKVELESSRKTTSTEKRVSAWLHENAVAEARARGDEFNLLQFEGEDPRSLPQTTKDSFEMYLFGKQPKVVQSIFKKLSPNTDTAAPPAADREQGADTAAEQDVKRFDLGKQLTPEERKRTLETLSDVYKENNLPKEMRTDARGEEYYVYPYKPEYFETSDITGANVRYYVIMPDGKKAHPTELFPDYTQSKIDAAMSEQRQKERWAKQDVKDTNKRIDIRGDESLHVARRKEWDANEKAHESSKGDARVKFYSEQEGKWYVTFDREQADRERSVLTSRGYREVTKLSNSAGANEQPVFKAEEYVDEAKEPAATLPKQEGEVKEPTDPEIPEGLKVKVKSTISGEIIEHDKDARKALADIDEDIALYRAIKDCLS